VAALEEQAMARLYEADPSSTHPTWSGLATYERCGYPGCNAPLQRLPGYFEWERHENPPWLRRSALSLRLLARTAMLATLESARPGALFARESVDAGQLFAGFIDVVDMHKQTVEGLLTPGVQLYIGSGRTAGLGKVEITDLDQHWDPLHALLGSPAQRLAEFTQRLPVALRAHWAFAPITLLTDMILLDPYLRAATALTPPLLAHYLALDHALDNSTPCPILPPGLELFLAVNATKRIAGWNTAAIPPRPRHDDHAIAAGSVFVLAAPPDQAQALEILCQTLETNGLGERRAEGFGQLAVAFPFHSQASVL
jgi:hypothetical protein